MPLRYQSSMLLRVPAEGSMCGVMKVGGRRVMPLRYQSLMPLRVPEQGGKGGVTKVGSKETALFRWLRV